MNGDDEKCLPSNLRRWPHAHVPGQSDLCLPVISAPSYNDGRLSIVIGAGSQGLGCKRPDQNRLEYRKNPPVRFLMHSLHTEVSQILDEVYKKMNASQLKAPVRIYLKT